MSTSVGRPTRPSEDCSPAVSTVSASTTGAAGAAAGFSAGGASSATTGAAGTSPAAPAFGGDSWTGAAAVEKSHAFARVGAFPVTSSAGTAPFCARTALTALAR